MKQPHQPYKPYPPVAPSPMIPVQKKISIQNIMEQTSTDTLETTLKKIVETVDANVIPMNQLHLQIEVDEGYGGSDFYGDAYTVNLVYYVEDTNPHYKQGMKYYKSAMVKHKAEMKKYDAAVLQYEKDMVTWKAEQEVKAAKEKKKLYNRLKKEFGDA